MITILSVTTVQAKRLYQDVVVKSQNHEVFYIHIGIHRSDCVDWLFTMFKLTVVDCIIDEGLKSSV